MPITMRDVALRAGVSRAAVSYVLNGREAPMRISDETKQRILNAVQELGYHPNALARGLAHKRTDTVAIVMQYPSLFSGWSGFTNEMMHGVTDAAIRLGYHVMLYTRQPEQRWLTDSSSVVSAEVATLTEGRVDGALLLRDGNDPLACALAERAFPVVLMFTHQDNPALWSVDCDNLRGGRLATEHLLALGHTRLAHLTGSPHSAAASERRQGFESAMGGAGLTVPPEWIVEQTHPRSDFSAIAALFDAPPARRPTAVFAWSDDVAMQMLQALRQKGLRVPEDVALVGYDSTALCDHTDPPLTSVRQPIYDMAAEAFTLLTRRLNGETPEQTQIRVAPELHIRRSCGAEDV